MQTIEIRPNRKKTIPLLIFVIVGFLGINGYLLFSGKYKMNNTFIGIFIFMLATMIYSLYFPVKRMIKNIPALVLSQYALEVAEKDTLVSLSWSQITACTFEKDDGTDYLIIEIEGRKRRINISLLEKSPFEIEMLIAAYYKP